jgi:hypothetical protein
MIELHQYKFEKCLLLLEGCLFVLKCLFDMSDCCVLRSDCSALRIQHRTVGDKVFMEGSHWFKNTATNRKAPSKLGCLPQSELCFILREGQSELRRQSDIPKGHFF